VGDKLTKQRSGEILGDSVGESERQIQRYIRLTELIPELLDLVDGRKMALRPAVELSYLTPDEQKVVFDETMIRDCMPSHAQTIRMRKMSERYMLTDSIIDDIMREEKPNQKEKKHIPYSEIRMFMPKGMSFEKTVDYIKKALEYYQKTYSE
jgi:ParB family chromosome partitioning protein